MPPPPAFFHGPMELTDILIARVQTAGVALDDIDASLALPPLSPPPPLSPEEGATEYPLPLGPPPEDQIRPPVYPPSPSVPSPPVRQAPLQTPPPAPVAPPASESPPAAQEARALSSTSLLAPPPASAPGDKEMAVFVAPAAEPTGEEDATAKLKKLKQEFLRKKREREQQQQMEMPDNSPVD